MDVKNSAQTLSLLVSELVIAIRVLAGYSSSVMSRERD